MMRDLLNTEIGVGDTIAFSAKGPYTSFLNVGIIDSIANQGTITVTKLFDGANPANVGKSIKILSSNVLKTVLVISKKETVTPVISSTVRKNMLQFQYVGITGKFTRTREEMKTLLSKLSAYWTDSGNGSYLIVGQNGVGTAKHTQALNKKTLLLTDTDFEELLKLNGLS